MLTIRFDDGYMDLLTGFKPILDSFNTVGVVCILTAMIGMAGYMTWENIKELYQWEISLHGLTDIDISILLPEEAEIHILAGRNILKREGYDCRNFVPHKAACWHGHIRDIGSKYFDSVHCGGVVPVKGVNPKIFDVYNMFAICGDSGMNWLAKDAVGISGVKEQLDIVKNEGRWLIYYLHNYTFEKGNGLKQIIEYALKKDIKI
jgi:peptidoglycan/xylan/chitin deacetylase (PgdA/CDA1 family)